MLDSRWVEPAVSTAVFVHSTQPWAPAKILKRLWYFCFCLSSKEQIIFLNHTICRSKLKRFSIFMNVFLKRVQIQICKSVLVDKSRRTELLVTSQSVVLWVFLWFFSGTRPWELCCRVWCWLASFPAESNRTDGRLAMKCGVKLNMWLNSQKGQSPYCMKGSLWLPQNWLEGLFFLCNYLLLFATGY